MYIYTHMHILLKKKNNMINPYKSIMNINFKSSNFSLRVDFSQFSHLQGLFGPPQGGVNRWHGWLGAGEVAGGVEGDLPHGAIA
jgi:hypothetical protein